MTFARRLRRTGLGCLLVMNIACQGGAEPRQTQDTNGPALDPGPFDGASDGRDGTSDNEASGPDGGSTRSADGGRSPVDAGPVSPDDGGDLVRALGLGANIGNTLENTSVWETGWGQPPITQAFIEGMARHGIRTVRVPVAWNTYALEGAIQPDKLARVRQVVRWIVDAGMYAIVNIHWDGGWITGEGSASKYTLSEQVSARFASYWTQIAEGFRDEGSHLIFEGLNEEGVFYVNGDPQGTPDYDALERLNQSFVDTVRAAGGANATRPLLVAGFATDLDRTCVPEFDLPHDPAGARKLLLSIHYYTPFAFCLLEEPANFWADVWTYPAVSWGTDVERADLDAHVTKMAACSAEKGAPIVLGEFAVTRGHGAYARTPEARVQWMRAVVEATLARGIVPVLWDTGSEISRVDGSLSPEFESAIRDLTPGE